MKMVVKKASNYKFRIVFTVSDNITLKRIQEILADEFNWSGSFVVQHTEGGIAIKIYDDYME